MGKPVLIKDKKQEVFDKAQSTSKGRELLESIEVFKGSWVNVIELCGKIRELAIEADFTIDELNMLAAIVFDKVDLNVYYKRKAKAILNPTIKEFDFTKLSKNIFDSPMKALSDKVMYEGDFVVFVPYEVLSSRNIIHMAKGDLGWYLRIRNGKPDNARLDTENDWINAEEFEIDPNLERKQLEAAIN